MFFPSNFVIFLNSASSAAPVFYLPGVCTHTDTKGKQRKAKVRNILKFLVKNTIFTEHPVHIYLSLVNPLKRILGQVLLFTSQIQIIVLKISDVEVTIIYC